MRRKRAARATGVHHPQVQTAATAKHVDRRSAVAEIHDHLPGHGLGKRRNPPGGHAVVSGHGQHQGRTDRKGQPPPAHGVQAGGQFFQPSQAAARLGQVVQMGLGRVQIFPAHGLNAQSGEKRFQLRRRKTDFLVHRRFVACPGRRRKDHCPLLPLQVGHDDYLVNKSVIPDGPDRPPKPPSRMRHTDGETLRGELCTIYIATPAGPPFSFCSAC